MKTPTLADSINASKAKWSREDYVREIDKLRTDALALEIRADEMRRIAKELVKETAKISTDDLPLIAGRLE